LSSAAITTYCTDKASFLLFILASLGPISARLISEGETAHMALGALGCLFIVFLSEIGNRTHKTNTDSFKALVKSQHLVGALSEEKYKSDVLNRRLQREIEERKDQEARIRRAKDDWERTFDATPDLITILDKNHRIVRANRPTLEKFGMDSDDVLGAQCFTLFHGTDRAPDNCPNNLLLKDGAPHCAEIFEERLNGIYNVSVSPLFNGNGALVGSVHVARDITDQKNTQKSLERIHKELEMMVRDRTEDLMNANVRLEEEVRQRQSAEKRIMASLKEKEILLQEIHHRVKNNLQIISSLVGLQESNIDEQGVLEALRDSKNRIKSMSLIHELLYQSSNLGRIEVAGYLRQLSKDLCRSYSDVLGRVDVRVSASKKRMGMDTAVPCGLIVNELVSNCLKHAFSDCRTGVVDVCFCEQDGSNYEISVSDNGKGLPGHVDFNSSRSLGLRLVRELAVNQLKGSVDISVNGGTRVTITFKERISPDGRAK
jgi:PAS domain S-box-containing protein